MPKYSFVLESRSVSIGYADVEAANFQEAAAKLADLTRTPGAVRWGEDPYDEQLAQTRVVSVLRDEKHMEGFPSARSAPGVVWEGHGNTVDVDDLPEELQSFEG